MISALEHALKAAETWPEEDQEALVAAARDIEAQRSGVYEATVEELGAVDCGIADAQDGHFASDAEVIALKAKFHSV